MSTERNIDILPDSRAKNAVNVTIMAYKGIGMNMVPLYCANCGVPGPLVFEANCTFAFWLCNENQNDCAAKWGALAGTWTEPDAVFFDRVKSEMLETYGYELSPQEIIEVLKDDSSVLSKLAKERITQPAPQFSVIL